MRMSAQIDNKITICHVLNRFGIGGMENGVVNICNRLDRSRFNPIICCLNALGPMAKRLNPSTQAYCMDYSKGFKFRNVIGLALFFKRSRVDIVHTHAWGEGSLYGILAARLARVPVVINGEHGSFFTKRHQKIAQRIIYSLCDANLSVSESLKIRVNTIIGLPLSSIKVIRNGVDTEIFNGNYPKREIIERLYSAGYLLDLQSFYVIVIGSLKLEKAPMMLLYALKRLMMDNPSMKLKILFVGDGPDREKMTSFIERESLHNAVFLLGNRGDVPELLCLADVLVSTSIARHEGMSNVMLEAMSSGVPVLATRSVGAAELVKDGVNGFLVEPGDETMLAGRLEELYHDVELLRGMRDNARTLIWDQYSIKRMLQEYEELYDDLIQEKMH